jgi:hypothetical protein
MINTAHIPYRLPLHLWHVRICSKKLTNLRLVVKAAKQDAVMIEYVIALLLRVCV